MSDDSSAGGSTKWVAHPANRTPEPRPDPEVPQTDETVFYIATCTTCQREYRPEPSCCGGMTCVAFGFARGEGGPNANGVITEAQDFPGFQPPRLPDFRYDVAETLGWLARHPMPGTLTGMVHLRHLKGSLSLEAWALPPAR
jgi:hypothetical protein